MAYRDPYFGYNFRVEIDGIQNAGFASCSGLDAVRSAVAYREGTDAQLHTRRVPGMVERSEVTLSRGLSNDTELAEWAARVRAGANERKNMSIVLIDDEGADKIRWNFRDCWPTAWSGPGFDATNSSLAIESMTIAHEGFEVAEWS